MPKVNPEENRLAIEELQRQIEELKVEKPKFEEPKPFKDIPFDPIRKIDKLTLGSIEGVTSIRAYNTGGQTLSTSTATKVELNTETFDTMEEFDSTTNYRFTATKEGYYFIHACLQGQPSSGDDKWYAYIYKNGAEYSEAINLSGGSEQFSTQITDILKLDGGDYIEIYIEQTSGGDQTMFEGEDKSFAIIHKII